MNRRKIVSLILTLMIAVCCVAEAWMIGNLRRENAALEEKMTALDRAILENTEAIAGAKQEIEKNVKTETMQLHLPGDLYVCEGMTMDIYNQNICSEDNPDDYDFYWECEIGDCMNDKFRISAREGQAGDYDLTLHLYNYRLEEIAQARSTLHVTRDAFAGEDAGTLDMLTIGDGLSASAPWLAYTRELSKEKLSHIGTLGDEEGLMSEGRPNVSPQDYFIGEPVSDEVGNFLINPQTGVFDWAYYKNATGNSPDVVQVFLGNNGLTMEPGESVDAIVSIVENIRESDPAIPVLVAGPIYPGDQSAMARQQNTEGMEGLRGMWSLARHRMVYEALKVLEERLSEYDDVTLVPVGAVFDTRYGFDQEYVAANPHSEVQERVSVRGIHPGEAGYRQIGDAIYSSLCYLIDTGALGLR